MTSLLPHTLDDLLALPPGVWTPLPILGALVAVYALAAPHFDTDRARAYILSAVSAAILSTTSLPFLYAWLTGGFGAAWEAGQSGWTAVMAQYVVAFFGVYLFAQLAVGYVAYRDQVGLLTGWIHHTVYIGLMIHLALGDQAPIFMTGAIMELPTLDLALSNMFPAVRSDERFLGLMVAFRIVLNFALLVDTLRPSSRALMSYSPVPSVMLGLALAMHASWLHGGITGYLKRRKRAATKAAEEKAVRAEAEEEDAGALTPDESPLVTPFTPSQPSVAIRDGIFPNAAFANLPIYNIPALKGLSEALPQAKASLNDLQFGIKEAYKGGRERLRLRRRNAAEVVEQVSVAA
ncbi:hypothetical protein VHUM_01000 [Vanrija humicola]|uniref:TLC domain-containing protein n=1 Tax=Vanrija humicola TaxID=5417 RepID=A0A7D8Z6W6_VANHU|nr:hypothetical protein VHUM_01000 [Vanrija humicola]